MSRLKHLALSCGGSSFSPSRMDSAFESQHCARFVCTCDFNTELVCDIDYARYLVRAALRQLARADVKIILEAVLACSRP